MGQAGITTFTESYDKCIWTFDNVIVPIYNGTLQKTPELSQHWKEFYLNYCASSHKQWEDQAVTKMDNWEGLVDEELKAVYVHNKEQETIAKICAVQPENPICK
jgi:hypothetical protein